jgi:uncharacterized protein with ParB-like and HNH nuclease domain
MITRKESLRKIVRFLNNPDEDGGFWLPNIQRNFVWGEEKICRLYDSIMREYPISTLLIWKCKSMIRRRKFIDNFLPEHKSHLAQFYVEPDNKKKCLVLDGQQRLQSLYIGLKGSYDGRELFLDILSGEAVAPDDIKYKFEFRKTSDSTFPWVKFKDLVFSEQDPVTTAEELCAKAGRELSTEEKKKISRHVGIIFKTFQGDEGIGYQELDSIENQNLYSDEDVVEVFIRANSGGTPLSKSDLLFSLLSVAWDEAGNKMEMLINEINDNERFDFARDFILKSCIAMLDQGARFNVDKFRNDLLKEKIEAQWDEISDAITSVKDFLVDRTFVKCDKTLPSYNLIIPLIYLRYKYPDAWENTIDKSSDVETYIIRLGLTGVFSGSSDQIIDLIILTIRASGKLDLEDIFKMVRSENRTLELTEDNLYDMGYRSNNIHLLFNLWYSFNYKPAYIGNVPQVDHIFPQSLLKKKKYSISQINQLANCMLLTADENGAGGKSDTPPDEWFKDKSSEYLQKHLIPNNPELWKLERFDDFIKERKRMINEKFAFILTPA